MNRNSPPWRLPAAGLLLAALSCSVGSGTGTASGSLNVANCWSGCYDLKPTFFGASPYLSTLQIRIEHGSDYESYSDGLEILVDDVAEIRANSLGRRIPVSLPPGVTPPGIPVTPVANPAGVHAVLYLQATCPTEDVALDAVGAVALGAGGSCTSADDAGGDATPEDASASFLACPGEADVAASFAPDAGADASTIADASGDGGGDSGGAISSWIQFDQLFDGNPDESSAAARLISGSFDFLLSDPRLMPSSATAPAPCGGHLAGTFHFYFERGQPAQPFP